MYKVIGCVIYSFIEYFICLDYLGIQKNVSAYDKKFENKFSGFSGLGITEILMNIISCPGFSKLTISVVFLTCQSALVPYN